MKNRKRLIFLIICLAVFVASVIAVAIYYCEAVTELNIILSEVTDTQERVGLEEGLIWSFFFTIAVLGAELSFIRSVYKMLKHEPVGIVRVCYTISALLALFLVIFLYLIFFRMAFFPKVGGENNTLNLLVLIEWPSFLLSFILGSIPMIGVARK